VVNIIEILTESSDPKRYWSDLKIQLKDSGFEPYENIVQLKLLAKDNKKRLRKKRAKGCPARKRKGFGFS